MFRHIQRFINSIKSLHRRKPPIPGGPQHIEIAPHQPRRPSHNWKSSRLRKQAAQLDAVMRIGDAYENVPVAAPEGYFWKQDRVGRKWRLYREPARGL